MLIIPRTHGLELAEFVRPFLLRPGNEAALGSGWSDWSHFSVFLGFSL